MLTVSKVTLFLLLCPIFLTQATGIRTASAANQTPIDVVNLLGTATPTMTFPAGVVGSGCAGLGVSPPQIAGPQFTLTTPTTLTEIGGFLNDPTVLQSNPTVQIRPADQTGAPDIARVLASYTLSNDHNQSLASYESVVINLTLQPGTYFALFTYGPSWGELLEYCANPYYLADGGDFGAIAIDDSGGLFNSRVVIGVGAVRILGTVSQSSLNVQQQKAIELAKAVVSYANKACNIINCPFYSGSILSAGITLIGHLTTVLNLANAIAILPTLSADLDSLHTAISTFGRTSSQAKSAAHQLCTDNGTLYTALVSTIPGLILLFPPPPCP